MGSVKRGSIKFCTVPLVVPALFARLVDDAAVFPPGNAPLPEAVTAHLTHRTAWYASLVGPLMVPTSPFGKASLVFTGTVVNADGSGAHWIVTLGSAIATVTRVGVGPACKDISHVELVSAVPPPTTGFLQLCVTLVGANPPPSALTTPIQFVIAGQQIAVAHASCAAPIELPAGSTVIAQQPTPFIGLIGAMTQPDGRVEGDDVLAQTATVTVVAGSTTIVTIIDLWVPDPGGDH